MKKVMVILMALIVALSGCSACAETASVDLSEYVGAWRPVWLELGYGPQEYELGGGEITIGADGTIASRYVSSEEIYVSTNVEITEADGIKTIAYSTDDGASWSALMVVPDYASAVQMEDILLAPRIAGGYYVYTRDFELAGEQPAELTNAAAEDFDGRWALKEAFNDGRIIAYKYAPSLMELGSVLKIDSENLSAEMQLITTNLVFSMSSDITDGVFSGVVPEDETYAIQCVLREDGTLKVMFSGIDFIYERALVDALHEYTEKEIIKAVQEAMNTQGFECGTPDGVAGKNTETAISGFQAANGLTETGTATHETLKKLRDLGIDLIAQFDLDE